MDGVIGLSGIDIDGCWTLTGSAALLFSSCWKTWLFQVNPLRLQHPSTNLSPEDLPLGQGQSIQQTLLKRVDPTSCSRQSFEYYILVNVINTGVGDLLICSSNVWLCHRYFTKWLNILDLRYLLDPSCLKSNFDLPPPVELLCHCSDKPSSGVSRWD